MSNEKSNSEAAILNRCEMALTNAEKQTVIASTLAEYGYDSPAFTAGKSLLNAAKESYRQNQNEAIDESNAYAQFSERRSELEKEYNLLRKKAKVVFRNDPLTLKQLGIHGEVSRVYVTWLQNVQTFCAVALANADIQQQLSRLKVDEAKLTLLETMCEQLNELRAKYLEEKGESQHATQLKDKAFAQLDDWMREFLAVSKIALEDSPQLLESLGVLVRN